MSCRRSLLRSYEPFRESLQTKEVQKSSVDYDPEKASPSVIETHGTSEKISDEVETPSIASLPHTNSSSSLQNERTRSCESDDESARLGSACEGWLSQALSVVSAGETLYVPAGVYSESRTLSLSMDGVKIKPERIKGEDVHVTFIVERSRDFLAIRGLGCGVSGVTFRHAAAGSTSKESEDEESRSAISVVRGSLKVEGCSFEELSSHAVDARRSGKISVEGCRFAKCNDVAVSCQDQAEARVADCVFDGNQSFSIWLSGEATGEFVSNLIRHNNKCAVVCGESSRGKFKNNVITRGNQGAFWLQDSSSCRLERNVMSKNRKAAVQVSGTSDPVLIRNKVVDGEGGGIVLHDQARGSFIGNLFAYGMRAGIGVMDFAAPLFVSNEISSNEGGGVIVAGQAQPVFAKNLVKRNGFVGFCVKEEAAPLLQENEITENNGFGVLLQGDAKACVQECSIVNNVRTGVSMFDRASLTLASSSILSSDRLCQRIGVHLHDRSEMLMEKCKLGGQSGGSVRMEGRSVSLMKGNEIKGSGSGVVMCREASASLESNVIVDSGEDGVVLSDQAEIYAWRNCITESRGSGVKSSGQSVCLLQHNVIMSNSRGVSLSSLGQTVVKGNRISDNSVCGLHVREGNTTVRENAIFGEQESAVSFGERASCDVIGNVVMHKSGAALTFPSKRSEALLLRDNIVQFPSSDEGKVKVLSSLPRHFLSRNVAVTSKQRELVDATLDLLSSSSSPVKLQIINPDGSSSVAVQSLSTFVSLGD